MDLKPGLLVPHLTGYVLGTREQRLNVVTSLAVVFGSEDYTGCSVAE